MKWLRISLGLVLSAVVLYAATLATKDCSVTPFFAANCLGLRVEQLLKLPSSRLFRAFVLEIVGLILLLVLYLTIRFVFPHRDRSSQQEKAETENPGTGGQSETGSIIEAEFRILRALCQEPSGSSLAASAKSILTNYHWREPIHEEIFRAIMNLPASSPVALRERIPALLTRRGFPDFDLGNLFKPSASTTEEVVELMKSFGQDR